MNQVAIINPSSISELSTVLSSYEKRNIFLLRGKKSFDVCGAKDKLKEIYKTYNVNEFSDFSNNPKYDEAIIAYDEFKKSNSDILLAIGGGSVIDMAKLVKHFYIIDNTQCFLPFIAIPTTAGTGSEATCFAVVYKNGIKESIQSEGLLPNHAIVDSNLLVGQSQYQMAVSGIDAFSQGIESYWNINANEESMLYSEQAIKLIWENLEAAITGNFKALELISKGSYFAGKAINITKTTAAHALSYNFTSFYGLAHGHAVALFLPFFTLLHKTAKLHLCNDTRGNEHLNNVMIRLSELLEVKFDEIELKVVEFINNLGLSINFNKLKISWGDYIKALEEINIERMNNNPVKFQNKYIFEIYEFNNKFSK